MTGVLEAFRTFEQIEGTKSSTQKIQLLEANKTNSVLTGLLVATYDPFVVYGVKKDPKVIPIEGDNKVNDDNLIEFFALIASLSSRELTGNRALDAVCAFFSGCTQREYKWYLRILQRDLKIGATEKTFNKVWPGLIPEFTCALANTFEPKKLPKEYVADFKLDGYRCLAFAYEDRVELRSRKGHPLHGFLGIEKDIAEYLPPGFVYDGEIMARDNTFKGVQKTAFKKSKKDEPSKDGILNIFDVVSIEEWEANEFKVPYVARMWFLDQITDVLEGCRSLDRVYQTAVLTDSEEDFGTLLAYHTQATERGFEGTMIKKADALYKKGKSNNILKLKDFYDIDLVVTGVYEGRPGTKYEGTLGGVTVDVADTDLILQCPTGDPKHTKKLQYIAGKTFETKVGSGMSDTERLEWFANPNLIIGKTIEIDFQETSINEQNEHHLRFATLVKVRDDK